MSEYPQADSPQWMEGVHEEEGLHGTEAEYRLILADHDKRLKTLNDISWKMQISHICFC